MEDRVAPKLREPGHVWDLVVHAGGQHERARPDLAAVAPRYDDESVALGARIDGLRIAKDDGIVGCELRAGQVVEVARRGAVMTEQSADVRRRSIALLTTVEHERPPASAPEHHRGTQSRHTAADDHAVVLDLVRRRGRLGFVTGRHRPSHGARTRWSRGGAPLSA